VTYKSRAYYKDEMVCARKYKNGPTDRPTDRSTDHPITRSTDHFHGNILLEKQTLPQLVKKFVESYGTGRFTAVITTARHISVS